MYTCVYFSFFFLSVFIYFLLFFCCLLLFVFPLLFSLSHSLSFSLTLLLALYPLFTIFRCLCPSISCNSTTKFQEYIYLCVYIYLIMFAYSVYVPSHQKYKTHFSTNDLRNLLASLLFIFQFLYRILGKGTQKNIGMPKRPR